MDFLLIIWLLSRLVLVVRLGGYTEGVSLNIFCILNQSITVILESLIEVLVSEVYVLLCSHRNISQENLDEI